MTFQNPKQISITAFFAILIFVSACGQSSITSEKEKNIDGSSISSQGAENKYKVTFIELGSVRCIPCQKMQPVLKSIEEKYGDKVKVVFHDVWTEDGAPYAKEYGIESIPTQVFLDEKGREFFRHVGFFAEADLVKVLNSKDIF